MKYYLAIDIGASSGRHLLAHMENGEEDTQSVSLMSRTQCSTPPAQGRNGVIRYEEIHRFANGMKEEEGHKVWDLDELFSEILTGMKKCVTLGKIPVSMGISWIFTKLNDTGILPLSSGNRIILLTVVISLAAALLFPHEDEEASAGKEAAE